MAEMSPTEKKFYKEVIHPSTGVQYAAMWIGPKNALEIEKALQGRPTMVDCPIGINLNDGTGADYYRKKKGFLLKSEMETWLTNHKPSDPVYPCPYCDFVGDSKQSLAGHLMGAHKRASTDYKNEHNEIENVEKKAAKAKGE